MLHQNIKDWNLILKGVAFLIAVIAFIAINTMEKAQQENLALLESIQLLEASFEAE